MQTSLIYFLDFFGLVKYGSPADYDFLIRRI